MKINDAFSLQFDGTCVTLMKTTPSKKKDDGTYTQEYTRPEGYFANLSDALKGFVEREIAEQQPKTINEMLKAQREIYALCDSIKNGSNKETLPTKQSLKDKIKKRTKK